MAKVLFLIDSLGSGGAQRQILNIVNSEKSYDLCIYRDTESPYNRAEARIISLTNSNVITRLIKLRSLAKGYDIVCPFLVTPSIYMLVATFGLNKRLLYNVRNRPFASRWPYPLFEFLVMTRADLILLNSFHAKDRIPQYMQSKSRVLYNGYERCEPELNELENKVIDILVVGRISKQKNTSNVVKALIYYAQRYCESKNRLNVKIIGRVEKDYKAIWQSCVSLLNAHNSVIAYEHVEYTNDMQYYYRTSKLLLHATCWEGTPNVVCEAMLNECPFIISNRSDWKHLTQDGRLGMVTDISLGGIVESLKSHFAKSDAEVSKSCKEARYWAEKNLSLDRLKENMRIILDEATNSLPCK